MSDERFIHRPYRSRGATLLELLVVIGVLLLLAALVAAGVHAARSASHRAVCTARLSQIGAAMHAYDSAHARFPFVGGGLEGFTASPISRLLPYLDEANLANSVNWSRLPFQLERTAVENKTVVRVRVATFLCPADRGVGGVNYFHGTGVGPRWQWHPERKQRVLTQGFEESVFRSLHSRRSSEFVYGFSKAIAFSERLQGDGLDEWYDSRRDILGNRHFGNAVIGLKPEEPYRNACQKAQAATGIWGSHYSFAGKNWLTPDLGHTGYNHGFPPNCRITDCGFVSGGVPTGIVGARSNHTGGVHALFCDGRVVWINDSIDSGVWIEYAAIAPLPQ